MEILVLNQIDEALAQYIDICKCQYCRCDIVALALNLLPPRYITSEKGELLLKVASTTVQTRSDVLAALTQAIIRVSNNPKHDY